MAADQSLRFVPLPIVVAKLVWTQRGTSRYRQMTDFVARVSESLVDRKLQILKEHYNPGADTGRHAADVLGETQFTVFTILND